MSQDAEDQTEADDARQQEQSEGETDQDDLVDVDALDFDDEDDSEDGESADATEESKPAKGEKEEAGGEVQAAPEEEEDVEEDADIDEVPAEEGTPAGDLVDEIEKDVEKIKDDGRLEPNRVLDMFDSIMKLHTLLLHAKLPKNVTSRRKSASTMTIADRLVIGTIAERIAARGVQMNRKDKDMMSDTGGTSKGKPKEPNMKPPRDDCRKPFRSKNKPADQRDPDTDMDPDLKGS
jgi:hypothetical protein